LLKIKYPREFPRTQRSIKDINIFKANEYRNLVFYSLIYVLRSFLKPEYYHHLVLYIVFIRILSQTSISAEDIELSRDCIHTFLYSFEHLYGQEHLSFNLHAHQHLPDQVLRFGPINKISCFSFEGVFKICNSLFNGTRNISKQIAENLNISSYMYFSAEQIAENAVNPGIKNLFKKIFKKNKKNNKNLHNTLCPPVDDLKLNDVPIEHMTLFVAKGSIKSIRMSLTANIDSFGNLKH
jgi:hypothetical protein